MLTRRLLQACLLLVVVAASPAERAGFFKGPPGGASLAVVVMIGTVFLPFIVLAPLAQYRAMREGRRWPGAVTAGMVLQLTLLPGFFVLANTEDHFWQQLVLAKAHDYDEARQRELKAGLAAPQTAREMAEAPAPYRLA